MDIGMTSPAMASKRLIMPYAQNHLDRRRHQHGFQVEEELPQRNFKISKEGTFINLELLCPELLRDKDHHIGDNQFRGSEQS